MVFIIRRIKDFLGNIKRAIDVALKDPVIKEALMVYNWDETVLNEGMELVIKAETMYQKQIKEKGEQFRARQIFEDLFEEVEQIVREDIKFTRLLCRKDEKKLAELGLNQRRDRTINGWIQQTKVYYGNLLTDDELVARHMRFGITKEKLEANYQKVLDVQTAKEQHDIETGEAEAATQERNEVFDEVYEYALQFGAVSKAALKDKPQHLEKLTIIEYSPGYKPVKDEDQADENETAV
jgi:hypothetical protein